MKFDRRQTRQRVVVLNVHLFRELSLDAILQIFNSREFALCFRISDGVRRYCVLQVVLPRRNVDLVLSG
jgi:hypothetical protein